MSRRVSSVFGSRMLAAVGVERLCTSIPKLRKCLLCMWLPFVDESDAFDRF